MKKKYYLWKIIYLILILKQNNYNNENTRNMDDLNKNVVYPFTLPALYIFLVMVIIMVFYKLGYKQNLCYFELFYILPNGIYLADHLLFFW